MNKYFIILLLLVSNLTVNSQNYWVFFTDKKDVTFDPYEYFDQKAIERRIEQGISLNDITDFPVNQQYIGGVATIADSVGFASRWFNALYVKAESWQIEQILALPYVSSVEPAGMMLQPASYDEYEKFDTVLDASDYVIAQGQLSVFGREILEKNNLDGAGVRIAIFDGGFPTIYTNPAFEHIRKENRIIKTWDFVKKNEKVDGYSSHGTMVMSCIAGIVNGTKLGLATGAEFLLARTEVSSEPYKEEVYWLEAVEWADKNGAQIINSSLGYTYHRYFNDQMDGRTSLVARAGNLAARKGILVVNAAGNDGSTPSWKYIGTPADADSVLAVGGIDPYERYHINFSSYGPTSDKRMKPNVSAFGHAVVSGKKGLTTAYGTSFASPLACGFVACILQENKGMKAMDLFHLIERSGSLYPYFDYAHGYGVPQASRALGIENAPEPTFEILEDSGYIKIHVFQVPLQEDPVKEHHYLYYNIMQPDGILKDYYVIEVSYENVLVIGIEEYEAGEKLNISYLGYYNSYTF